jgi:CheY-like chemotaxis protein
VNPGLELELPQEKKKMEKQPKILIVDDDEAMVEAMKIILEAKSYQVVTAYSKEEGMERVRDSKPDLIILDVMMDHMTDGFQASRELKSDPQTAHIPILMLTAIHREMDSRLSPGFVRYSPETDDEYLPVDDFLDKPVQPSDLVDRVEKLLEKQAST